MNHLLYVLKFLDTNKHTVMNLQEYWVGMDHKKLEDFWMIR